MVQWVFTSGMVFHVQLVGLELEFPLFNATHQVEEVALVKATPMATYHSQRKRTSRDVDMQVATAPAYGECFLFNLCVKLFLSQRSSGIGIVFAFLASIWLVLFPVHME